MGKICKVKILRRVKHYTLKYLYRLTGFMNDVVPIVRYHHERFEGGGYPNPDRSGTRIPLGARIIAVADAFDAMTSDRPYRKALPKEEALQELKRCAGSQFDPEVVKAFLRDS